MHPQQSSVTLAYNLQMRTNKLCSFLFGVTVDWYKQSRRLLLSTYYDHSNLLTTLPELQSFEHSLMRYVSVWPSAAINGLRRLMLSTYSTVEICWQHSTLHQSS